MFTPTGILLRVFPLDIRPTGVSIMSREERSTYWQGLIDKQAESGLSAAAFCREHQLNVYHFYNWRRRLRYNGLPTGFVELVADQENAASGIRIRLSDDLCIEVERGFDPFTLRSVMETVQGGEG